MLYGQPQVHSRDRRGNFQDENLYGGGRQEGIYGVAGTNQTLRGAIPPLHGRKFPQYFVNSGKIDLLFRYLAILKANLSVIDAKLYHCRFVIA